MDVIQTISSGGVDDQLDAISAAGVADAAERHELDRPLVVPQIESGKEEV